MERLERRGNNGNAETGQYGGSGHTWSNRIGREKAAGTISLPGGRIPPGSGCDPRIPQRADPAGYGAAEIKASPDPLQADKPESGSYQAPSEIKGDTILHPVGVLRFFVYRGMGKGRRLAVSHSP